MDKYIISVLKFDESKSFTVVEPFYRPYAFHNWPPSPALPNQAGEKGVGAF